MIDIGRWMDEEPPGVPEAVVVLRDALMDYIRANDSLANDLVFDGSITPEEARRTWPHMDRCRALLKELEEWEINPTLEGLLIKRSR